MLVVGVRNAVSQILLDYFTCIEYYIITLLSSNSQPKSLSYTFFVCHLVHRLHMSLLSLSSVRRAENTIAGDRTGLHLG